VNEHPEMIRPRANMGHTGSKGKKNKEEQEEQQEPAGTEEKAAVAETNARTNAVHLKPPVSLGRRSHLSLTSKRKPSRYV